ncbi:unnamed protein product [Leptidea sinapis]|uniref:Uncharacterized protein n=1 Tax=Leptidea sinapis TaxID=189913 RepID=A0A5E4QR60_9NEOP|nr:unnamed protein product [Leptidea sinapis]
MQHPQVITEVNPLLKHEGVDGSGDNKPVSQPPVAVVTTATGWNVRCVPKGSWMARWPEFISACWMTLMLLTISFLVFYTLGISAYRRQPVVIMRCNNSKPASNVYYHHIVPRGSLLPFTLFSEYLSNIAGQYPYLRFNVNFLIDDSLPNAAAGRSGKKSRIFNRLVPIMPSTINTIIEQSVMRDVRDFERRYQNVNITIMLLSRYMATTPLKNNWRNIPISYLSFYARIFNIRQSGGIGLDLVTFNDIFHNYQEINPKITAILKQHNDGIDAKKYTDILRSLNSESENELISMFLNVINNVLNLTCAYFNAGVRHEVNVFENKPLIRTHRSKRELRDDVKLSTKSFENLTGTTNLDNNNRTQPICNTTQSNDTYEIVNTTDVLKSNNLTKETDAVVDINEAHNFVLNSTDIANELPQWLIFYDLSLYSDIGSSYLLPLPSVKQDSQDIAPMKITEFKKLARPTTYNQLSLSSDGLFIAAPQRFHPFLSQLLSTSCKRVNPSIAIKDTFMSQCSNFLRDDVYCDGIFIFNSIF